MVEEYSFLCSSILSLLWQAMPVDAQRPITSAGHRDPNDSKALHEATPSSQPSTFRPQTASFINNHGHAKSLLGKNSSFPLAAKPGECSKLTELSALS